MYLCTITVTPHSIIICVCDLVTACHSWVIHKWRNTIFQIIYSPLPLAYIAIQGMVLQCFISYLSPFEVMSFMDGPIDLYEGKKEEKFFIIKRRCRISQCNFRQLLKLVSYSVMQRNHLLFLQIPWNGGSKKMFCNTYLAKESFRN